jgi:hypothetical protein
MPGKNLIILGSKFNYLHEYDLPNMIDGNSRWNVFSIDIIPLENNKRKSSVDNIKINRMSMNITSIFEKKEIAGIQNSEIYIMDSISCGFITNTAKKLVRLFIPNNDVYFVHYISPSMENPSFNLNDYEDYVLEDLLESCGTYIDSSKKSKIINNIIKVIRLQPEPINIENFTQKLLPPSMDRTKFLNCGKGYLSNMDIPLIDFTKVNRIDTDLETLKYLTNCSFANNVDSESPRKKLSPRRKSPPKLKNRKKSPRRKHHAPFID